MLTFRLWIARGVEGGLLTLCRWLPETKVTAPEEVTAALRRAVIEVFTLVQARGNFRALWQRENPEDPTFEDWTADVKLDASEDNDAVLAFPSTEVKEQALRVLGIPDEQARDTARRDGAGPGAALSREEMTEARGEATLSYHRRWRHISLQNPDVKFAVGATNDTLFPGHADAHPDHQESHAAHRHSLA